jgi:hypothetical protein
MLMRRRRCDVMRARWIAATAIWQCRTAPEPWSIGRPGGGDVFPIRGSTAITFQED